MRNKAIEKLIARIRLYDEQINILEDQTLNLINVSALTERLLSPDELANSVLDLLGYPEEGDGMSPKYLYRQNEDPFRISADEGVDLDEITGFRREYYLLLILNFTDGNERYTPQETILKLKKELEVINGLKQPTLL